MNTLLKKFLSTGALAFWMLPVMPMVPDTKEQEGIGSIVGRIVNTASNALPRANIYIEELHQGTMSDNNGYYVFPELKPGTYSLRVSYVGYKTKTVKLVVKANQTRKKDFILIDGIMLQDVEVKGVFDVQRNALQMQKMMMGMTNVVSADEVDKFPDSNIGDALKRISGVNVQYDQGEATFAHVRGTGANLSSVTVNGNRVASAEENTRNAQLDLIPADMIQSIELHKVVTSDMDGDAIGGEINLVTKNTPSRKIVNMNVGSGYSWLSEKPQWDLSGTWGNRLFGKKLGFMLAGSYQNIQIGSDHTEFEYLPSEQGTVVLKEAQVRQYYITRERQSYSLALDYRIHPLHRIAIKAMYNRRAEWENRYRLSFKKLNEEASNQSVAFQTGGGTSDTDNAKEKLQQTIDIMLDGVHYLGTLKVDWAFNFNRASEEVPSERYVAYALKGVEFASSFSDVNGEHPYSTASLPTLSDTRLVLDELNNLHSDVAETDWKGRINFSLPLSKGLYGNDLRFGAKWIRKHKTRHSRYYKYKPSEWITNSWRDYTITEIRPGFTPTGLYATGLSFIDNKYLSSLSLPTTEEYELYEKEPGDYDITERVTAGYLRFDQKLGPKLSATAGLRMERTDLSVISSNINPETNDGKWVSTGKQRRHYVDWLPSLLVKYRFSPYGNLRASATHTLARPKYGSLLGNSVINGGSKKAVLSEGNTMPAEATNIDLGIDYYFKSVGMTGLALFYKDIHRIKVDWTSYLVTGSDMGLTGKYASTIFKTTQCLTAYDARLFGIEASYQRDFGFISPELSCLGFYGNYTYTHSDTRNYNPLLNVQEGEEVRTAGSPEHTANASLYFEKSGLRIRLSYNFSSAFIEQMGTMRELDLWYDKVSYLDFNASYSWGKRAKYTLYVDAKNLLNQPKRYYQGNSSRTQLAEYYDMKMQAGFKIAL